MPHWLHCTGIFIARHFHWLDNAIIIVEAHLCSKPGDGLCGTRRRAAENLLQNFNKLLPLERIPA